MRCRATRHSTKLHKVKLQNSHFIAKNKIMQTQISIYSRIGFAKVFNLKTIKKRARVK